MYIPPILDTCNFPEAWSEAQKVTAKQPSSFVRLKLHYPPTAMCRWICFSAEVIPPSFHPKAGEGYPGKGMEKPEQSHSSNQVPW